MTHEKTAEYKVFQNDLLDFISEFICKLSRNNFLHAFYNNAGSGFHTHNTIGYRKVISLKQQADWITPWRFLINFE